MRLAVILLLASLWAQGAAAWVPGECVPGQLLRQGLTIMVTVCPQDPPVDVERIKAQRTQGCGASDVRFGDVALMRGTLDGIEWTPGERRALSTAALSDDLDVALAPLRESIDEAGGGSLKQAVLTHQAALTALQFRDPALARALLAGVTVPPDAPADVAFDQSFLAIMAEADGAGADAWRGELLPRLDALSIADTPAFGLRAWRLYGWFLAGRHGSDQSCDAAIEDFIERVLDVSEASACPLLLGHFEHALDRRLRSARQTASPGEKAWRLLASGVLASVSGRDSAAALAQANLEAVATECAPRLGATLARTRAAAQEVGQ